MEPDHEAAPRTEHPMQLAKVSPGVVPEVESVDRHQLVEGLVWVGDARTVREREPHPACVDETLASTPRYPEHRFRCVDSPDQPILTDRLGCALDGAAMAAAHVEHPVSLLKLQECECLVVRRCRLERHDVADDPAEQPSRITGLPRDELRPPHASRPSARGERPRCT